ncbi:uncharacterized protein LOC116349762 [Contarinia nasturtii]|uniref:uncharacterized protein LOC116349762 n=1 Tax=Contarinia nasturtii TaxID=265458 RepID=UPI0012D4A124|nr:uncharacterized protein LOC116349762 [Contarinia nasturtii]
MGNIQRKLSLRKSNEENDIRTGTKKGNNVCIYTKKEKDSEKNEEISGPAYIFTLNNDCFQALFPYMPLKDLVALGQTCKFFRQNTGEFFRKNYSAAKTVCQCDGIRVFDSHTMWGDKRRIAIPDYNEFVTSTGLSDSLGSYNYMKLHYKEFKMLKNLTLADVCLKRYHIHCLRPILRTIEELHLLSCTVTEDLYTLLLQYCVNMKRLHVQLFDSDFSPKYEWLINVYPKLEHFELIVCDGPTKAEFLAFFQLNPKVRSFSCHYSTLDKISNDSKQFIEASVKLDSLGLKFDYRHSSKKQLELLNHFHIDGSFNKLHLSTDLGDWENLAPFSGNENPFVEKLFIDSCVSFKKMKPLLNQLTELAETKSDPPKRFVFDIEDGYEDEDDLEYEDEYQFEAKGKGKGKEKSNETEISTYVNDLVNIERLYFENPSEIDILPFIQRLKKLKKIKLIQRTTWPVVLKLRKLNAEREKLDGAGKVTIYLPDKDFLATKWASKNGSTNFSKIQIKRLDSFEWNLSIHEYKGLVRNTPAGDGRRYKNIRSRELVRTFFHPKSLATSSRISFD